MSTWTPEPSAAVSLASFDRLNACPATTIATMATSSPNQRERPGAETECRIAFAELHRGVLLIACGACVIGASGRRGAALGRSSRGETARDQERPLVAQVDGLGAEQLPGPEVGQLFEVARPVDVRAREDRTEQVVLRDVTVEVTDEPRDARAIV